MKGAFNFLMMLLVAGQVSGQADFSKGSGIIFQPVPNGFITQLPRAASQVIGDYYLSNDWRTGKLYLNSNQAIEGLPIRYESKLNQFEIKDGDIVKVLHGSLVAYFSWINTESGSEETYLRLQDCTLNGAKIIGFARIISDGENFKMFCITRFSESIPSYNVAMDVGNRNAFVKKELTYVLGKQSELIALEGSKKKVVKAVSDFTEIDIAAFVKQQKLNFRSESDFALLNLELNKNKKS
jgi:hypothetical protein